MNSPVHFTTAAIEPRRRLARWNDASIATFGPLVVDSSEEDFSAELTCFPLDAIQVCSAQSSKAAITKLHRPSRSSNDAVVHIVVQDAGTSLFTLGSGSHVLAPGDFTVVDPERHYEIKFDDPIRCIIVRLPRRHFGWRADQIDRLVGSSFCGGASGARIFSDFARSAWRHMRADWRSDWSRSLEASIWNLTDLIRPGAPARAAATRGDYWLDVAKRHIGAHLCDPELGAPAIARALGVSDRYVHALFAAEMTTPSRYILGRRLEEAANRIGRNPVRARITEIALDLGFNDLSYFSRSFRARFGLSPRQWQVSGRVA